MRPVRPSSPPSLRSLPAPMSTTHPRQVPLILGIWGPKGMGKTFQTELALKKMGVEAVVMSAGELEHEWAGTPGRLIRERYRKAADMSKVRGIMTTLLSECFATKRVVCSSVLGGWALQGRMGPCPKWEGFCWANIKRNSQV